MAESIIDRAYKTVVIDGQTHTVPAKLQKPGDILEYVHAQTKTDQGPVEVPVGAQLAPTQGVQGAEAPARPGLAQRYAIGALEGAGRTVGAMLPGVSGEDVVSGMQRFSPSVMPSNYTTPETYAERAVDFVGQQQGASLPLYPIAGTAAALRRGPQMLQQMGRNLPQALKSDAMYSLAGGGITALGETPEQQAVAGTVGFALPIASRALAVKAVRSGFVGGDDEFTAFKDRLRRWDEIGAQPASVGVVSPKIRPLEATLESVPGTFAQFHRASQRVHDQLSDTALQLRQSVSYEDTPMAAGKAIQDGLTGTPTRRGWLDTFRVEASKRYDALDQIMGRVRLKVNPADLAPPKPSDPRTPKINEAIGRQASGDPDLDNLITAINDDLTANGGSLPYGTLKAARQWVGDRLTSTDFIGNAEFPRAAYKRVYGVISNWLATGAAAAGAGKEFQRANAYWSKNIETVDKLADILAQRGDTPERIFNWAMADVKEGPSRIMELRGRLSKGQFDVVRSAMLRRLGLPMESAPDDFGNGFSPVRFMNNYQKMSEDARRALFGGIYVDLKGSRIGLHEALDKLADVAYQMREAGGVMANPSGTAGRGLNAATLWAVLLGGAAMAGGAVGGIVGQDPQAAGAGAGVGVTSAIPLAYVMSRGTVSRLFTNPKFITWLAEAQSLSPQRIPSHLARLNEVVTDPSSQAAVQEYLSVLMEVNARNAQTAIPQMNNAPFK